MGDLPFYFNECFVTTSVGGRLRPRQRTFKDLALPFCSSSIDLSTQT